MNNFSNIGLKLDIDKNLVNITKPPIVLIKNHLKDNGQMIVWLAHKVGLDKDYLTNVLNGVYPLTEKNRQKINEVLKTDF